LLSTPQQIELAEQANELLGNAASGIYARATMHTPVAITEDALTQLRALKADGLVALGGGSTIGLSKAIAVRADLPQIVIPTTYAGSEMTPIVGETRDDLKITQRDPKVLPETVIYDVDLTLSLPSALSVTSGVNAIAHAVEALYAVDRNPIISLMAVEGITALARALPVILTNPSDAGSRSSALYGAWLCGGCLGAVGMAFHHKLCHTLGGTFNLPHAETHTVILPHAIAYNSRHAAEAMARVAGALGATDAADATFKLIKRLGAKQALRDLGMPKSGIERAAELAVQSPYPNPRPIEYQAIKDLLTRAWVGDPPEI
jgi:alcohol dehydrogenase class IV